VALALGTACGRGFHGQVVEPAAPAAEIVGDSARGGPFRLSDARGKVVVLTFGYSHCPDVCPMTLAKLAQVFRELGARAAGATAVLVTIDPARDSREALGAYLAGFDARFVGVVLGAGELAHAREAYGVTVAARPGGDRAPEAVAERYYTLDHTSGYFLIDRNGRLRVRHAADASADAIAGDVERLLVAD
jgi:protein SCO1/2